MKRYLESERLYLREFTLQEGNLLVDLDSDDLVVRYTGKTKMNLEQANNFIQSNIKNSYPNKLGFFACFEKETNSFIGWFHLRKEMNLETDVLEIGYRLKRHFWNNGYATEMSQKLIKYGFNLGAKIISAITLEENKASSNVMIKCNMEFDKKIDYKGFIVDRYIVHRGEHFKRQWPLKEEAYEFCIKSNLLFKEIFDSKININKYIIEDPFISLCESIIYQQISIKAGLTVWKKFCSLIWPLTPHSILNKSDEEIQKCGLSFRKVSYLKHLASYYLENKDVFDQIKSMSDKDVIEFLIKIKGIGPWTAEMFLMFCLGRQNVSSYLDLALRKQVEKILHIDNISKKEFDNYLDNYSPYKTTASFFLWALSINKM